MDRTTVKVTTLAEQDEAFCLSLSLDDRLRVQEELNRQGRILAGYPASAPLPRTVRTFFLTPLDSGSAI